MITAGVPVTVRGADLPLADQPAAAMLLDVLQSACAPETLTERLARGASRRAGRRGGHRVPAAAAPSPAPGSSATRRPAGPARHRRSRRRGAARVRRVAGGPRVARVLAAARGGRDAGANAEELLWASWAATGLAGRWESASAAGGAPGAAADRDLDAVVALFDAAARYVDRLPGAAPAVSSTTCAAQQIPGDALSAGAERGRRGLDPHRPRQQGPGMGSRLRRRRAGGQLARPAAARARCWAPSSSSTVAGRSTRPAVDRPRRSSPRSGGCSTSRSRGPGARLVVTAVARRGRAAVPVPRRARSASTASAGRSRTAPRRAPARPGRRAAGGARATRDAAPTSGGRPPASWPASPTPGCQAPTRTSGGASRRCARRAGSVDPDRPVPISPSAIESFLALRVERAC